MVLFCPISKKKYSWQSVQCLLLGRSVCVTSNHILGFLFVLLPSTCWYFPPGTRGSELSSHTLSLPLPSHNLSVKSKFPFSKDMGGVGGGGVCPVDWEPPHLLPLLIERAIIITAYCIANWPFQVHAGAFIIIWWCSCNVTAFPAVCISNKDGRRNDVDCTHIRQHERDILGKENDAT